MKIFQADKRHPWSQSHAQCPTAIQMDGFVRVFYASRDINNVSRISYFDGVPSVHGFKVTYRHDSPVLDVGDRGRWDDSGVIPCSVIHHPSGALWLFYVGFSPKVTGDFNNAVGVAWSIDGGMSFQRKCAGPVLSTGS